MKEKKVRAEMLKALNNIDDKISAEAKTETCSKCKKPIGKIESEMFYGFCEHCYSIIFEEIENFCEK